MRRNKLYPLVALLAASAAGKASPAAAQGLVDVRAIKPVMMLLVDTSGSMEYKTYSAGHTTDELPNCTSAPTTRNRWHVTLEALTGGFEGFQCVQRSRSSYNDGQLDRNYFIPHFDFTSTSQAQNGLLDAYKTRIKFGLMTFDGVTTTFEGDTMVPFASYRQSATGVRDQVLGSQGMYSYPDATEDEKVATEGFGWMRMAFPNCPSDSGYGINAGARGKSPDPNNPLPGALISVGASDSASDVQGVNQKIQESLLKVRPYGGTPIAGMLDDLRYYLRSDPDVKKGSDPYFECRRRFAILLTDGAPDKLYRGDTRFGFDCTQATGYDCSGKDCCPYDPEEMIAENLVSKDGLEKLWVVAFNVNDPTALAKLNQIALEGNNGTCSPASNCDAIQANTPNELSSKLDTLMNLAAPNSTSRSVPVITNTGKPVLLGGRQYEIVAGFKVPGADDIPWEGNLYRKRITCDGAAPKEQTLADGEGDMFHLRLNTQSASGTPRTLYTVHPDASAKSGNLYSKYSNDEDSGSFTSTPNALRPDGSSFSTYTDSPDGTQSTAQAATHNDALLASFDENTPPSYFGDADGNGTPAQSSDVVAINKYLRGLTDNRKSRTLGDIYHSNPTVLPPLVAGSELLNAFDPNQRNFYRNLVKVGDDARYGVGGRPGVVFVGTNDGILHAFNLEKWTSKSNVEYAAGHEFWGFVPPALFGDLARTVQPSHKEMFDGTPIVREVTFRRSLSSGTPKIGTVLLAAVRGAPAYIALDVTYPEEPKLLWQRSFKYLGNTVATPAIGHVKVSWNNDTQVRAVAILPGGEGEANGSGECNVEFDGRGSAPSGRSKVRCWKLRGRSLYVVDMLTGELLQEFDARHFHSPLTGSVAVDSQNFELTQAAYLTDEDGILWRLSMLTSDPSKWRVQPIWDLYAGDARDFSGNVASVPTPTASKGRPATNPPLLTRDPQNGTWTILVGTGNVDNLTDTVPQRVVSLKEARTLNSDKELATGGVSANWVLQLDAGESVTGPLVVYDDALYFSSFKGPSSSDLCEMGTSRLVGGHVRKVDSSGRPQPMLVPEGGGSRVLSYLPSDATNSLLLGLSIARDPICMAAAPQTDPNAPAPTRFTQTGAAGGGSYTLRSMVASDGSSDSDAVKKPLEGSGLRQLTRSLPIPNIARSVGWASSIE